MSSKSLYILWDESQIWGLLAWRGALGLGLPYRLVRAKEIRQGLLADKPPAMLLVPGGTARLKSEALGPEGLQNIRDYVAGGGHYLGFCGGAGLGLTPLEGKEDEALGLCPWSRAAYTDRIQHFMSGHLQVSFPHPEHLLGPPEPAGTQVACATESPIGSNEQRLPEQEDAQALYSSGSEGSNCESGFVSNSCQNSQGSSQASRTQTESLSNEKMQVFAEISIDDRNCQDNSSLPGGATRLISGPLLPVWWPGRFSPKLAPNASPLAGDAVVLATYGPPGEDFWLADLPTRLLPPSAFSDWQNLYGVSLSPEYLDGQPCLVHGSYGKGSYTLSYSHLETPNSPFANAWLAKIIATLGGFKFTQQSVPAWQLDTQNIVWPETGLLRARHLMRGLIDLGLEHSLLFRRNDWLYGWRSGVPGLQLTNLYAALASIVSLPPGDSAVEFWGQKQADILKKMEIFAEAAGNYLLAERLAQTLAKREPETVSNHLLAGQRASLFGERMRPGGLYKEIMDAFDELAWLQIEG